MAGWAKHSSYIILSDFYIGYMRFSNFTYEEPWGLDVITRKAGTRFKHGSVCLPDSFIHHILFPTSLSVNASQIPGNLLRTLKSGSSKIDNIIIQTHYWSNYRNVLRKNDENDFWGRLGNGLSGCIFFIFY